LGWAEGVFLYAYVEGKCLFPVMVLRIKRGDYSRGSENHSQEKRKEVSEPKPSQRKYHKGDIESIR